jgi:hypothetical protein
MKKLIYILTLLFSQVTLGQFFRTTPFILDNNGYYWSNPIFYLKPSPTQVTQIINLNVNEIRGLDTTQGGCSDYDLSIVRTSGVVYGRNFGQSNGRIQLSLIDRRADTLLNNKCGIGLYKRNQSLPVTLNEGDSIIVIGKDTCFNGLSQINIDSVRVLKVGANLIQPTVVNTLDEISESYLVKLLNVEFIPTFWQSSPTGSGFTAQAFVGTPGTADYQTFDIRIDNDCDLFGQPMPQGKVDIVGIGGQFDSSIPRDDKYQLLPRSVTDITPAAPVELPVINFVSTTYLVDESSTFSIPINSSVPVTSQISCLVVSQNITTDSLDYQIQQPNLATFPIGLNTTSFGFTILSDGLEEGIESFQLKLKKLSDNYSIGSDSIATINISSSVSVDKLLNKGYYFYKSDGRLMSNFPSDFIGDIYVYDSFGRLIIKSKNGQINQDFENINKYPNSVYRVVINSQNQRIIKNLVK